jgi:hypothetical protein
MTWKPDCKTGGGRISDVSTPDVTPPSGKGKRAGPIGPNIRNSTVSYEWGIQDWVFEVHLYSAWVACPCGAKAIYAEKNSHKAKMVTKGTWTRSERDLKTGKWADPTTTELKENSQNIRGGSEFKAIKDDCECIPGKKPSAGWKEVDVYHGGVGASG